MVVENHSGGPEVIGVTDVAVGIASITIDTASNAGHSTSAATPSTLSAPGWQV
jgi:hypothetical protein